MLKFRNITPSLLIVILALTSCQEPSENASDQSATEESQEQLNAGSETVDSQESEAAALLEEAESLEAEAEEAETKEAEAEPEAPKVAPKVMKPITYSGPGQLVTVETRLGRIVIKLHDETPGHRDNFVKLAGEEFFNGTTFHRIMEGFMVQGGDPLSKDPHFTNDGQGDPGYSLPAEIKREFFHKNGAVASARKNDQFNPDRESNGSQFYIVHGGNEVTDEMLDQMQERLRKSIPDPDFAYTEEERAEYIQNGGAFFLDGMYTIFGEVVEGLDILAEMGSVETYRKTGNNILGDQPTDKMDMTVKVIR